MAQNMESHTPVESMTDRELLEEIVTNMRTVNDVVNSLADHPMVAAIANGQNPMMALMGR